MASRILERLACPRGASFCLIYSLLISSPAYAIQTHKAPEGLYIHQAGHILFMIAMIYFFLKLKNNPLLYGKGWRYIKLSCILFFLWNMTAFIGHWFEALMPDQPFIGIEGMWDRSLAEVPAEIGIPFYISKFDHLLSVPAILFFFLGTREFSKGQK